MARSLLTLIVWIMPAFPSDAFGGGTTPDGVEPPGWAHAACAADEPPQTLSLRELWREGTDEEPGYVAARETLAAEAALASAARREWLPSPSVQGVGNHGQRLSPGEERVLGVGPRGELRLIGTWTLLDSDRSRRAELARVRGREAVAAEGTFDVGYRGSLAIAYADAAAAEAIHEIHRAYLDGFRELAGPVGERMAAGVDVRWEGHILDEGLARAERSLADAVRLRAAAREELSMHVGRCVRAAPLDPREEIAPAESSRIRSPDVEFLVSQAETREAQARQEADRGRWQLQLVGIVGPNHSRAFEDDRIRNEYLVGVSASWRPDPAGVRARLAASEEARARALRAQAESLRRSYERDLARIRVELEHASLRRAGLVAEREQAERRERVALQRWEEGVDRWNEVMQAKERLLEVRLLEVELNREVAIALTRRAEATGRLDELPRDLGQEESP